MANARCGHSRLNRIQSTDKNNFHSESFQCDDCKTIFLPSAEHKKWLRFKAIEILYEEACRDVPDNWAPQMPDLIRLVAEYLKESER